MTSVAPAPMSAQSSDLRARSTAFALLARLLGPDVTGLVDGVTVEALRRTLDICAPDIAPRLDGHSPEALPSAEELAGRWVRWFDLGRVAPYEGSNVAVTVAGVTPRLADISGFYRAFGLRASKDRPDHIVAELEFLALALLVEAEAIDNPPATSPAIAAAADQVDTVTRAIRSFVRDHLGSWVDVWAARVGEVDALEPWSALAATASDMVRHEAALRNVIPVRDDAVIVADAGIADDEESWPSCGEGEGADVW